MFFFFACLVLLFQSLSGQEPPVWVRLVSQTASNGGTSRLSVDSQGVIRVQFDAGHNDVTGHFQTFDMNPADNNFLTPTADGYILFHDWLC